MAAASSTAFSVSRSADLSLPHHQPPPYSRHLLIRPFLPSLSTAAKRRPAILSCLVSGVDGGGVSDEFVSTRKSGTFDREFSVIASMLKRIEPLDNSVISKGVSDSAKDSMKQTISTMLGLLPSDQFLVMVRVSKRPLDRLLASSLITGYTLWNAEYRIMLMRNFEISHTEMSKKLSSNEDNEISAWRIESECVGMDCGSEESERLNLQSCLGDLSPDVMNYIRQLESELSTAKKDLHAQQQENVQIENTRESKNDLLKYLRSLDPEMVNELSRPSSPEVEDIIRQLVQCTSKRFFKEETPSDSMGDSEDCQSHENDDFCDTMGTSRDYLAKLLFWCMLMGHHLRCLENRLHLSCAVGLL